MEVGRRGKGCCTEPAGELGLWGGKPPAARSMPGERPQQVPGGTKDRGDLERHLRLQQRELRALVTALCPMVFMTLAKSLPCSRGREGGGALGGFRSDPDCESEGAASGRGSTSEPLSVWPAGAQCPGTVAPLLCCLRELSAPEPL